MADQNNNFTVSPLPLLGLPIITPIFFRPKFDDQDTIDHLTYLGTPVYSNLVFNQDQDVPNYENQPFSIDTVIFTVEQTSIVIKTPIAGRKGTQKEYISQGDYLIQIDGLLVNKNDQVAPYDDVIALKTFLALPRSIGVSSKFLQLFSVSSIVHERSRFFEMPGYRNQIGFSIQAVSDFPIEIKASKSYLG